MPSILFHTAEDRLGDALIKLPAILALKRQRPDITLVWTTAERPSAYGRSLAPLVANVIDELHEQSGLGTQWRQVVRAGCTRFFDCVIASDRRLRSTLALRRIPHGRFIAPARNFHWSHGRPSHVDYTRLPVYRQTQILLELAIEQPLNLSRHLSLPPSVVEQAATLLPADRLYVGFAPGAGGRDKCWPLAHFIDAARAALTRDRIPVFFLGPEELAWRSEIAANLPLARFPEFDAAGRPHAAGPLLTIALAARTLANVANDSGAGHLLAASGQRLLSLFGRTDAAKFEPPYGSRTVLRATDFGSTDVAAIPTDAVIHALNELCDE